MIQADNTQRLGAVDDLAAMLGMEPGKTVSDALALTPLITIVEAELDADARALAALADWCTRFSPAVAVDGLDGLVMDIEGCPHLWGGEEEMARALLERLRADAIPAHIGIADTFGAAWALARFGEEEIEIAHGDERDLLSAFPISALRIDQRVNHQLNHLGFKTIDTLLPVPREALCKRFGDELLLRIDQALGREDEAIHFRYPPSPWLERRVFAEPISAPDSIRQVLHDLSSALCARLNDEGLGARTFEIVYHRIDGEAARRGVQTALPARDVKRLVKLFAPKLETIDPGFGIEIVTLRADDVSPLKPNQLDIEHISAETRAIDLAPLVDRLQNTFGAENVWRAGLFESHVPERAVAHISPLAPSSEKAWPFDKPRPIRLFDNPHPINVIAPVPDDPPLRFTWRNHTHRIRRAEGPERIGAEWWRKQWADNGIDRIRDYYRVEDETGARFWVFRTGLYGGERPTRWYLHGVFS